MEFMEILTICISYLLLTWVFLPWNCYIKSQAHAPWKPTPTWWRRSTIRGRSTSRGGLIAKNSPSSKSTRLPPSTRPRHSTIAKSTPSSASPLSPSSSISSTRASPSPRTKQPPSSSPSPSSSRPIIPTYDASSTHSSSKWAINHQFTLWLLPSLKTSITRTAISEGIRWGLSHLSLTPQTLSKYSAILKNSWMTVTLELSVRPFCQALPCTRLMRTLWGSGVLKLGRSLNIVTKLCSTIP